MRIILEFVSGSDVFVSLPSGKSLCYSALPWTFDTLRRQTSESMLHDHCG